MPSTNIVSKTVCITESGVVGIASGQMVRFSVANMGESTVYILGGRFLDTEGKTLRHDNKRRAIGPGEAFLFDLDRGSVATPGNRIEVQAIVAFTGEPTTVHSTAQLVNLETGRNTDDYSIPAKVQTKLVCVAHSGVVGITFGEMARFSVINRGESPIHILGGRFLDTDGNTLRQDLDIRDVAPGQAFLFDLDRASVEAPGNRIEVQAFVEFSGEPDTVLTTTQAFDLNTGRSGGLWQNHNQTVVRDMMGTKTDTIPLPNTEESNTAECPNLPVSLPDLNRKATSYRAQGEYREAERVLRRALQLMESQCGSLNRNLYPFLNNLGVACKYIGRLSECEPLYRRALAIAESEPEPDAEDLATLYHNLGGIEHARRSYPQGEVFSRHAVEIRLKALGADHPDVAADLAALAAILDAQGKYDEAEPLHLRALAVLESVYGPEHIDVAIALNNLAALNQAKGACAQAERLYCRALAIKEKVCGPGHPEVGITINNLAVLYTSLGKHREADRWYRRAMAILDATLGPEHPDAKTCRTNHAALRVRRGEVLAIVVDRVPVGGPG